MSFCLRVYDGDQLAGVLGWRIGTGGTVEIEDITAVLDRRKGYGRQMIEKLIDEVPSHTRTIYAFCRSTNTNARKFYEALGFTKTLIPGFYQDDPHSNEDAMLYVKHVGGGP
jgi:ribosomal protein S18 acetylase RimI-like enzyme